MRTIVSLITALAVNLHLLLGCCAHHAHGGQPTEQLGLDHAHYVGASHAHHGAHHHEHPAPQDQPAAPWFPPHDDCHGSHCAFLLAGAVKFTPDLTLAWYALPVEPPAPAMVEARGVEPRDRGDPSELAVDLFLRHQAFLS